VSKSVSAWAEPHFYRVVILYNDRNLESFVTTIKSKPELGHHIEYLWVSPRDIQSPISAFFTDNLNAVVNESKQKAYTSATFLLTCCPNLKSLALHKFLIDQILSSTPSTAPFPFQLDELVTVGFTVANTGLHYQRRLPSKHFCAVTELGPTFIDDLSPYCTNLDGAIGGAEEEEVDSDSEDGSAGDVSEEESNADSEEGAELESLVLFVTDASIGIFALTASVVLWGILERSKTISRIYVNIPPNAQVPQLMPHPRLTMRSLQQPINEVLLEEWKERALTRTVGYELPADAQPSINSSRSVQSIARALFITID
jgi:hypothetical protein